jgi:hypothetical protein
LLLGLRSKNKVDLRVANLLFKIGNHCMG